MKRALAWILAALVCASLFSACVIEQEREKEPARPTDTPAPVVTEAPVIPADASSYTYSVCAAKLPECWDPNNCTTAEERELAGWLSSPLVRRLPEDTANGVSVWAYEMAESIRDVTAEHQSDLTKYGADLGVRDASVINAGYVFEITLNRNARWENGEAVTADDYLYSLRMLLDPKLENRGAARFLGDDCAAAGAAAYYDSGRVTWLENSLEDDYGIDDLKSVAGSYRTPAGVQVYIALDSPLAALGGATLSETAEKLGADPAVWEELSALSDGDHRVPLTETSLEIFGRLFAAGYSDPDGEADATPNPEERPAVSVGACLVYPKTSPVSGFGRVGFYKTDDYTLCYVCASPVDIDRFMAFCSESRLVYRPYYEAGMNKDGTRSDYCTRAENTISCGPYRMESADGDRIVLTVNPNWHGWVVEGGSLCAYTSTLVDGEHVERFRTTRIVMTVMDPLEARDAFLSGVLTVWKPETGERLKGVDPSLLYKTEEENALCLVFNTDPAALARLDRRGGNINTTVLTSESFRKAVSLALSRADIASLGEYSPLLGLVPPACAYDVFGDPGDTYRGAEPAMRAICAMYGVSYGEGEEYPGLPSAYASVTGYDEERARELFAEAFEELTESGAYAPGEEILIRVACSGAPSARETELIVMINEYVAAASRDTGFGSITFVGIGAADTDEAVASGRFAAGLSIIRCADRDAFQIMGAFCDPKAAGLAEAACWDPSREELTVPVRGRQVKMTYREWIAAMKGTGRYAGEPAEMRLAALAEMERSLLEKAVRIPLLSFRTVVAVSARAQYITAKHDPLYAWGGFELLAYNYDDSAWEEYLAGR
ncbi:MAG: hypothetical protein J5586_00410 [Clostridia bacterium]|nr:hypothetical protein [Clostridia bacterium]